jgi:hypothetical protein
VEIRKVDVGDGLANIVFSVVIHILAGLPPWIQFPLFYMEIIDLQFLISDTIKIRGKREMAI